ncbi:MAG: ComF family protein [Bacteroidetes bacterium]|nr:ComF family protein [Bacteroidota bacterium]MBT5530984.1 ComF family protein [Cytophagia bacterium]MBT3424586.1 ComF family protein [Bacteroidota bacterium]MBT3933012.1 ComF family protein [Bacteroidota bacterium]MBT4339456.1 ComF family protein [Bacteroidota bacterium]
MSTKNEGPFKDAIDFFYPRNCVACACVLTRQEVNICLECKTTLPRTNFHLIKENPISKVFWGRVPIEWATAYFYFAKESRVQKLLHHIKYLGFKDLGYEVGQWLGDDLKLNSSLASDLDFIVPVPLHPKKQHKRGYNQSELLAGGIADSLDKKLNINNLVREIHSPTQTKKSRFKRWENVKDIFQLKDANEFNGSHVLLVDDVITTGSTIEACCHTLLQCHQIKISIASIAYVAY